jgi:hypothetical protein
VFFLHAVHPTASAQGPSGPGLEVVLQLSTSAYTPPPGLHSTVWPPLQDVDYGSQARVSTPCTLGYVEPASSRAGDAHVAPHAVCTMGNRLHLQELRYSTGQAYNGVSIKRAAQGRSSACEEGNVPW